MLPLQFLEYILHSLLQSAWELVGALWIFVDESVLTLYQKISLHFLQLSSSHPPLWDLVWGSFLPVAFFILNSTLLLLPYQLEVLRTMPPSSKNMSSPESLEPLNMLPNMVKMTLWMGLRLLTLKWRDVPGLSGWSCLIMILKSKEPSWPWSERGWGWKKCQREATDTFLSLKMMEGIMN